MKTTNPVLQVLWRTKLLAAPPAHLTQKERSAAGVLAVSATQVIPPFALDQSSWDPTDYALVDPLPKLVYLRGSYGAGYRDPMLVTHVQGWRSRNVPITIYHFFRYAESVRGQVDIFKSQVIAAGGVLVLSYPVVLDIEGALPSGMTALQASARLWQWIDLINRELGTAVWIYSSANYLNYLRTNGNLPNWCTYPDAISGAPRRFAIAGYPLDPNSFTTMPSYYWPNGLDATKQKWLWQYADDLYVTGIQGAQDANQVLVDIPPYGSIPPTIPLPEPSAGLKFEVIGATLNVRSGPGTGYADVGDLQQGDVVTALDVSGDNSWIQIGANRWVAVRVSPTTYCRRV